MQAAWNRFGVAAICLAIAVGALTLGNRTTPAYGGGEKVAGGAAHYTVVETEGHNLLVTDNTSNTLYFYTVDKGEPVGSTMHLRGTIDLTQVGKATVTPMKTKKD